MSRFADSYDTQKYLVDAVTTLLARYKDIEDKVKETNESTETLDYRIQRVTTSWFEGQGVIDKRLKF